MSFLPDIEMGMLTTGAFPWLYLPVAVALGALHALEPGHSKSLMAGYIVATRGRASDAVVLGVSAAIGHTAVVWAIALAALALDDDLLEHRVVPWLALVSGLATVGLAIFVWRHATRAACAQDHGHSHDHAHDHSHGHDHAHPPMRTGKLAAAWFGLGGGLMPCPSAIAVLLLCLQLQALALGVAIVAAFSVGIAITLVGVGVAAAWGLARVGGRFESALRWAPKISALLIAVIGAVLTLGALDTLGLV